MNTVVIVAKRNSVIYCLIFVKKEILNVNIVEARPLGN